MKKSTLSVALASFVTFLLLSVLGCEIPHDTDERLEVAQEALMAEATAAVGMPNITNFRERRLLAQILELRDQEGLSTYTYLVSEYSDLTLLCRSVGYGIPYATQFTNPMREEYVYNGGAVSLPQADPNGLFSPESAEGTWVMCSNGEDVRPVYVEPRVIVSTFPLDALVRAAEGSE